MNGEFRDILSFGKFDPKAVFSRFQLSKRRLLLLALAALAMIALIEFFVLGLARRTFIFYTSDSGIATVEERLLRVSRGKPRNSSHREVNITRYVEEAVLGPISPNFLPLFPAETRLVSLLYRDGVVYVNLSEDALFPPREGAVGPGGEVFINMETLYTGIKRNFPFVRDVRFFIAGKAAYTGKFQQ